MSDAKCLFGLHHYKIIKEETITDARGNVTGKIIVSACENCGKLKTTRIITTE